MHSLCRVGGEKSLLYQPTLDRNLCFYVNSGDLGLKFCLPVEIARFVGRGPPPAELRGVARRLRRCLLGATSVSSRLNFPRLFPYFL
ncbi:hypothetical protein Bca4012_041572 [Brassica carinata]